jgi:hypothetical protein
MWDEKQMFLINSQSYTDANGWASLIKGFGGNTDYSKLLPFQLEKDNKLSDGLNEPTNETISALRLLYKQGKVPRSVVISLASSGILDKMLG